MLWNSRHPRWQETATSPGLGLLHTQSLCMTVETLYTNQKYLQTNDTCQIKHVSHLRTHSAIAEVINSRLQHMLLHCTFLNIVSLFSNV